MRSYHHEQAGPTYTVMFVLGLISIALAFVFHGTMWVPSVTVGAAFIVTAVAFGKLLVDVDGNSLSWSLTFGWPRGEIPFDQIVHVQIVPVNFWMGIGIHLTFRGWVWNVSLGRGVQIVRPNGIAVVLGTDDPEGLVEAITRVRAA